MLWTAESDQNRIAMRWFGRDKEKERYYLLPGMGGRSLRRKRRIILGWSIAAGLFTSAIVAALIYILGGGMSSR